MKKDGDIVSYMGEGVRASADGEEETDCERVDAMTEEELEAAMASDPDWAEIPPDWYKQRRPIIPRRCARRSGCASTRLSRRGSSGRGPGIGRVNAALRAFVEAHERAGRE